MTRERLVDMFKYYLEQSRKLDSPRLTEYLEKTVTLWEDYEQDSETYQTGPDEPQATGSHS